MATWVTHLMIADSVLERMPQLDAHGFCVGSIAPDCNVENEDWTAFTPPREVTHFMGSKKKNADDGERFYAQCVGESGNRSAPDEKTSFLLGYYAHLIADAEFQRMITDGERVAAMWRRFECEEPLMRRAQDMDRTWSSAKKLFTREERFREREIIEAEYLEEHPDSGYYTHILALRSFPDYLDFLPPGSIVRKIGVMGDVPRKSASDSEPVCISREEYLSYVEKTAAIVTGSLRKKGF